MQFTTLGKTDIKVSSISMGCWAIVGGLNWGHQEESASLEALRAAYDAGITFFDTAEMYGDGLSEQLIAKALHDVRSEIVIASKVSPQHFAPADLRKACERSLKNLKTDYIDLYQLHWPNRAVPLEDSIDMLIRLKDEGKIRSYGVSNFGPNDLNASIQHAAEITSNQLAYSMLFRAIEFDIAPICKREDISILCYSPLLHGLLTGKFASINEIPEDRARTRHFNSNIWPQARHGEPGFETEMMDVIEGLRALADGLGESMANMALAWLLRQPGVGAVVMGGRNADQVRRNAQAASTSLSGDVIEALDSMSQPLKRLMGRNADMWQSTSRID
ncbi:MAG: aldo/keto reductase [Bacteroidota bacterium]